MIRYKILFLLIFCCLCLNPSIGWSEALSNPAAQDKRSSIHQLIWQIKICVDLDNCEHQGSGFFIEPNIFATAFHNLYPPHSKEQTASLDEPPLIVLIQLKQQKEISEGIKIISADPLYDLALLETSERTPYYFDMETQSPIGSEKLFSLGYSKNILKAIHSTGKFLLFNDSGFVFSVNHPLTPHGISGGPVINRNGQLAGINIMFIEGASSIVATTADYLNKLYNGSIGIRCEDYLHCLQETEDIANMSETAKLRLRKQHDHSKSAVKTTP